MNREIKFRVWDISHKEFIPTDCYGIITTDFKAFGVMLKDWDNYKEGEYFYSNAQVLQQFTGLKDKNGKEIYEGDIVSVDVLVSEEGDVLVGNEFDLDEEPDFLKPPKNDYAFATVEFHMGSFIAAVHDSEDYQKIMPCEIMPDCIVMGNRFENPELLD